jgi:uncharacterized protein with NRDE domain
MCTLLLGRDVSATGEILIAANRDEDPVRPSDPPGVLLEAPRLLGGRDRVAGGTWLAVRPDLPAVTMLLNRPPVAGAPPATRSRGLLVLDVASAADPLATARAAPASGHYGPCTLVFASPDASWWLAWGGARAGGSARMGEIAPGWHAITHAEMDDANEPRTAWLERELARLDAGDTDTTLEQLAQRLRHHGSENSPPVCIHAGRMPTVSASLVALSRERVLYRHAEGRPCEHAFVDVFQGAAGEALRRAGTPAPPGPLSGGRP